MSSFDNLKHLRFIITLGTGKFGSSTANQITLEGFRAVVNIDKAGGMMMGTLRASIYGVSQSDMNSATTLQWKPQDRIVNTVDVYAIDGDQDTLIFSGNIVNAWGDYDSMPDVFLMIQAQSALRAQLKPVSPRSFPGQIEVASVMDQIAASMGYSFENNGVSVQTNDLYLAGTDLMQAQTLTTMFGIPLYIDSRTLAITNPNAPRQVLIPEISGASGLKGYPTFDGVGVTFDMIFNPAVVFGGSIKLVTSITQAAGEFIVVSLSYHLESEKPNGVWLQTVRGNKNGLALS